MVQQHLDAGTTYEEDNLPQAYGRETFRANDFYDQLGNWELNCVNTYNKARNPVTMGDECEIVKQLFPKYLKLAQEYYRDEIGNIELKADEPTYENVGEE